MNLEKVAVLGTSSCRKDTWCSKGRTVVNSEPSELLTRLVKEGYKIYLATTRPNLHPELDAFIMEVVPEERRFFPVGAVDSYADATAPCFRGQWENILNHLEIPWGELMVNHLTEKLPTWLDFRALAREHGVVVG